MTANLLERITMTPGVMDGRPCVRGTRLTVRYVLGLLAHGADVAEIRTDHPSLTDDDIRACLAYAAHTLDQLAPAALSA